MNGRVLGIGFLDDRVDGREKIVLKIKGPIHKNQACNIDLKVILDATYFSCSVDFLH
jgi:hypothetical protein